MQTIQIEESKAAETTTGSNSGGAPQTKKDRPARSVLTPEASPAAETAPRSGTSNNVRSAPPATEEVLLTMRTPDEILRMEFSNEDLFLENGIFAKGQPFTMVGPGGVGKSFLVLQLAACTIIGRPFLKWNVCQRPLRWLMMQGENSTRRIKADLAKLRAWIGEDEWPLVDRNLKFHTLEHDHDSDMSIDDVSGQNRVARAIKDAKADVVLYDPLYAFSTGNMNSDAGMRRTLHRIAKLTRLGNPHAAPFIVHHSQMGKVGIKKIFGLDRSAYGRNSKSLQFWSRGQLNIGPIDEHSNDRLLVGCGKNSNGPNFEPFAIRRDGLGIFEVDPTFDFETWREQIEEVGRGSRFDLNPEAIARYVQDVPLRRKDLVHAVIEENGCCPATAYAAIRAADGITVLRNVSGEYEAVIGAAD